MKLLKTTDAPSYREYLLKQQNGLCYLCGKPLSLEDSCLDHDHDTGQVRAVLHANCNRTEGIFKHWLNVVAKGNEKDWMLNVMDYWDTDWNDQPLYHRHPSDMTNKFKKLNKSQMVELLVDYYPDKDLKKLKKQELVTLYRKLWNEQFEYFEVPILH